MNEADTHFKKSAILAFFNDSNLKDVSFIINNELLWSTQVLTISLISRFKPYTTLLLIGIHVIIMK